MTVPVSFQVHIRPLFREIDIEEMRDAPFVGFDLGNLAEVRTRAEAIYAKLNATSNGMPCDGPWPLEWIALFRRWIDEGMME